MASVSVEGRDHFKEGIQTFTLERLASGDSSCGFQDLPTRP